MTNDEMETRILRLETRLTATQVLLHTLLPATVPDRRHQILRQFGQYCAATEADLKAQGVPQADQRWQLAELAHMYSALEGALKLLQEWEAKRKGA